MAACSGTGAEWRVPRLVSWVALQSLLGMLDDVPLSRRRRVIVA
jgi:hypothetical protein